MNDPSQNISVLERPVSAAPPTSAPVTRAPDARRWTGLLRGLPTLAVLAALVGLGWWGHERDWKIPAFSELLGNGDSTPDDWCAEHAVPESLCVECNPALLPLAPQYGFCKLHGVHNCPFEHPDLVQLKTSYLIDSADLERAKRALDLKSRPENSPNCQLHHRRIQLASLEAMNKMEILLVPVDRGAIVETIGATGEIIFPQPSVAPVHTQVAGRLWQVTDLGRIGTTVRKGDVLALVDALEVGKAKVEFLGAYAQLDLRTKTLERLQGLAARGATTEAQLRDAEAGSQEARIRLLAARQALANLGLPIRLEELQGLTPDEAADRVQALGLPGDLVKTLDASSPMGNLVPVRASRDGVITSVKVVEGERVEVSSPLFIVADTNQMWLILNVRQEDVKYLRARDVGTRMAGQQVRFRPDGSGEDVTGELVWIGKEVDERTRTVQVRADLPNADGKLLAHTFGSGQIVIRTEAKALLVPSQAVHWEGDCHIVFVQDKNFHQKDAPKVFHVRTVRPGVQNGLNTEIIAGVLPGEIVASKNSALLRAELLKNRLGEG